MGGMPPPRLTADGRVPGVSIGRDGLPEGGGTIRGQASMDRIAAMRGGGGWAPPGTGGVGNRPALDPTLVNTRGMDGPVASALAQREPRRERYGYGGGGGIDPRMMSWLGQMYGGRTY
jgi:hypothetical protein